LLLMAFLQRIVNGGGNIEREYAAGRGRVDLIISYGGRRNIVEINSCIPPTAEAPPWMRASSRSRATTTRSAGLFNWSI